MKNTTFVNCYRKVQFAYDDLRWYGNEMTVGNRVIYSDEGDGEKNAGFIDLDGHFSDGKPSYVLSPHLNGTIVTGTEIMSAFKTYALNVIFCNLT